MTKVHPNGRTLVSTLHQSTTATSMVSKSNSDGNCRSLTVWKKSLLLNFHGFTVFDSKGNLAFRVDKYRSAGEIVLMDAFGKPLLTIRRKRFSISENWLVYDGETSSNHILSVRKRVSLLLSNTSSCLARVSKRGALVYEINGSYTKRCCSILDCNRQVVAEIRRKEVAVDGVAFGFDVFKLIIVNPDLNLIEASVAMALVILLDEMFGSSL